MTTKNVSAEIVNFAVKRRSYACAFEAEIEAADPSKERVHLDLSVFLSLIDGRRIAVYFAVVHLCQSPKYLGPVHTERF
ncbi:hypothetical protein C7S15_0215 [Burkholderia cepacia]|uniref:hypothetical protein n=1 Tax=Burkholderia cepacia TaxID=292 RepID=UPI0029904B80|nr:hypothetical protein [Burkholderia cepacia]MDW9225684.1 hypothetical protein [Burkholderia cepacia]